MRVVNQAELVLQPGQGNTEKLNHVGNVTNFKRNAEKRHKVSPEEEIPEWILAKVEEEDGECEDGSKKERSARMWTMSKGRFSLFLGCFMLSW